MTKALALTLLIGGLVSEGMAVSPVKLPLHTAGRHIVDAEGNRVKLACTNWYGAHLHTYVQNGLSQNSLPNIVANIVNLGFNCVRLPYATEAYFKDPPVHAEYISKLANQSGRRFLDVFDEVVDAITGAGLMVVVNNHNTYAGWCCSESDGNSLWFNRDYDEGAFIASLQGLARRYRSNLFVVGFDLRNEVRGGYFSGAVGGRLTIDMPFWGETVDSLSLGPLSLRFWDYHTAMERAGVAVLKESPDALIVVEALYFSRWLCPFQVANFPLRGLDGHVVWSAHEYPWNNRVVALAADMCKEEYTATEFVMRVAITEGRHVLVDVFLGIPGVCMTLLAGLIFMIRQSHHERQACSRCLTCIAVCLFIVPALSMIAWALVPANPIDSYDAFSASRDAAWGHLANSGLGPVWVAEFGGDENSEQWNWTMTYLRERDFDFAYWSIDGEHFPVAAAEHGEHILGMVQEETYGLLNADYRTVRHEWKLRDIQSLMVARLPSIPLRSASDAELPTSLRGPEL